MSGIDPYSQALQAIRGAELNAARGIGQCGVDLYPVTGADGETLHLQRVLDISRGEPQRTGRDLDICISSASGPGWYMVVQDGEGRELATRDGRLHLDAEGRICINDYPIMSEGGGHVEAPPAFMRLRVEPDGQIIATERDGKEEKCGVVCLRRWINEQGLEQVENNCFLPTEAAGDFVEAAPGNQAPRVIAGYLEGSNVDLKAQSDVMKAASQQATFAVALERVMGEMREAPARILQTA